MASRAENRDRYRQYARFLRNSADRLNDEITPGGLDQLVSRVNVERYKFMIWGDYLAAGSNYRRRADNHDCRRSV